MTQTSTWLDDSVARWETQLRKGVLELVILLSLREREIWFRTDFRDRQSILARVIGRHDLPASSAARERGFDPVAPGAGDGGAPRKYYSVTPHGRQMLAAMTAGWAKLVASVEALATSETNQ